MRRCIRGSSGERRSSGSTLGTSHRTIGLALVLAEQHPLGAELQAVQRPHVGLAQALHRHRSSPAIGPVAQARVDHLGGHRGRRERHVDADGAGRAHGVGGVADQQQAVARPVADEADDALQREERA